MTRQRKEIHREMEELYQEEQAEHELGCGFFSKEISEAFALLWQKLYEKLAATYGKTVEEYEAMCYEAQKKYAAGVIPFC